MFQCISCHSRFFPLKYDCTSNNVDRSKAGAVGYPAAGSPDNTGRPGEIKPLARPSSCLRTITITASCTIMADTSSLEKPKLVIASVSKRVCRYLGRAIAADAQLRGLSSPKGDSTAFHQMSAVRISL